MAKLVSELRPSRAEQPVLNENDAPSTAVTAFGALLIALLALGAIAVVVFAFRA